MKAAPCQHRRDGDDEQQDPDVNPPIAGQLIRAQADPATASARGSGCGLPDQRRRPSRLGLQLLVAPLIGGPLLLRDPQRPPAAA